MFLALCSVIGALQFLSPDHWFPVSILSWRRGYGVRKTFFLALGVVALHLALGFGLAWLAQRFLVPTDLVLQSSVALVLACVWLRAARFRDASTTLRGRTNLGAIWKRMIFWMGPSEALIPVLLHAKWSGVSIQHASLAFALGTFAFALPMILVARFAWNRTFSLPRSLGWVESRSAFAPAAFVVVAGVVAATLLSRV